ncbi:glycine cleavage system aminomethyltransferase GcvT [Magnetococcus sp. PR-3]|uniref:glycine cleavage system aminomethyltransferase GcvT n=1 Tax=Magnetococcus sp. PR-3 TaxID=3120355 RepID=UPI002FCE00AA
MSHQTTLYARHVAAGAKMVDFAGWSMPVNYGSQVQEHHLVRTAVGMFDVCHMGHVLIQGEQATAYLQFLLANDVTKLKQSGQAIYTAMLNSSGGVIDDLIVYRDSPTQYHIVVNAANRQGDLRWMQDRVIDFEGVTVSLDETLGMIAVQGPEAAAKVAQVFEDDAVKGLKPFNSISQQNGRIARTGYTGEDGFELIFDQQTIGILWDKLVALGVAPIGLGARDTLRLEAGLNLYGSDMDHKIDPLACGMAWTIAWDPTTRMFLGRDYLELLRESGGSPQQRVGLILENKGVLRAGQPVLYRGRPSGHITSGTWSPTLEKGIAMARLDAAIEIGQTVDVVIRNRSMPARVVGLPFVRRGQAVYKES